MLHPFSVDLSKLALSLETVTLKLYHVELVSYNSHLSMILYPQKLLNCSLTIIRR